MSANRVCAGTTNASCFTVAGCRQCGKQVTAIVTSPRVFDQAVTITVRLQSNKLQFPNGAPQTVRVPPGNRNKTLQFDVVARARVVVYVLSPQFTRGGDRLERWTVQGSLASSARLLHLLRAPDSGARRTKPI